MIDHDHDHVPDGRRDDGGSVGDGADGLCNVKLWKVAW